MRIRYLLAGAVCCLLMVHQVSANCLCDAKGEDYCSCKGPIRPMPKLLDRLAAAKFPPIGDSCWCGKQVVEPAVPPKPPCKSPESPKCDCCPKGPPPPPPLPPCLANLAPPKKIPVGIPADPISIGLAMTAGKAYAVPEAKLSYGPPKAPLNGLKKIYYSNIPEEKLYALNSEVIELKRRMPKKEEIIEEEEEEEEEAPAPPPYLTYQELGYAPEKFKNPLFMRYHGYAPACPNKAEEKRKLAMGCGFKLGKITQNAKLVDDPYSYDDCL